MSAKTVKQITIKMPNEAGQLASISELLRDAGVNVTALFVTTATAGGEGLMRLVADYTDKALNVLTTQGIEVDVREVLAAETPHHAGGLMAILGPLNRAGINVNYLYPCIQSGTSAILILGTDDVDAAGVVLEKEWIKLYGEELYQR